MAHIYNKKLYYKNSNMFRCWEVHYISGSEFLLPGRNSVSQSFSKFPRDPVPLKVAGMWYGTAILKGIGAWLLDLLVRFSTGLGDSCFGFVLFTTRFVWSTVESCSEFFHGPGQTFRYVVRPNFGLVVCIWNLVWIFCGIISVCSAGSIFGVSGPLIFILFMGVH